MCGINGVYNHLNLNDPRSQVLNMNSMSSHRGPDHTDIYIDQDVVLGHNRLSIIDLDKRSNQPFICSDKKVILSFNGEIYNFQELKSQLKQYHFQFFYLIYLFFLLIVCNLEIHKKLLLVLNN